MATNNTGSFVFTTNAGEEYFLGYALDSQGKPYFRDLTRRVSLDGRDYVDNRISFDPGFDMKTLNLKDQPIASGAPDEVMEKIKEYTDLLNKKFKQD